MELHVAGGPSRAAARFARPLFRRPGVCGGASRALLQRMHKKEEPLVVTSGPSLGRKRPSKATGPKPDCCQGNARAKRLRTFISAATAREVQFRINTVPNHHSRMREGKIHLGWRQL